MKIKRMIVFSAIVSHPLVGIDDAGTEKEAKGISKTLRSLGDLESELEKSKPDTLIVISPHAEAEDYNFVINSSFSLSGRLDLSGFEKEFKFKNDLDIVRQIEYCGELVDLFIHRRSHSLDYGALVPLAHLLKNISPRVVHMSPSLLSYEKHYEFGELLSNVLRNSKKRIAIIASGELSHRLAPDAPAGYSPEAKFFDYWVLNHLSNNDVKALVNMEKSKIEEAVECGLRPLLMMLGMIYQEKYGFNILSYETSTGTGYLVARFI